MHTRLLWLLFAGIVSGCEGTLPVAASCPPPPPPPEVLLASPSTGPSLTERLESLLGELRRSLEKATRLGKD